MVLDLDGAKALASALVMSAHSPDDDEARALAKALMTSKMHIDFGPTAK